MKRYPERPQLAGNMREQVTLQFPTYEPDPDGQLQETWHDVGTFYARVEPLDGQERFEAGKIDASYSVRFHIRYREGVTPEWRVIYRGEVFNIQHVRNPDERRMFLALECEVT